MITTATAGRQLNVYEGVNGGANVVSPYGDKLKRADFHTCCKWMNLEDMMQREIRQTQAMQFHYAKSRGDR